MAHTAWLIENTQSSNTVRVWLRLAEKTSYGNRTVTWTTNAYDALHLARQVDGEHILTYMWRDLPDWIKVTEHMFYDVSDLPSDTVDATHDELHSHRMFDEGCPNHHD